MNSPYPSNEFEAQQSLQQDQINAQMGMSSPILMHDHQQFQAALVEQTNPNRILENIEMKLKGYKESIDDNGKLFYEEVSEPLMNEKGIGRMLFILSGIVNQNTILSHLEAREISGMIIRVSDDIIDDLVLNWKNYDVKDKILLDYIVDVVLFPSFIALKRGWKQNEKNWLGKITLETLNTSPRFTPSKKEGFLGKFKL